MDVLENIKEAIGILNQENDNGLLLLKFVENCIFMESLSHHWHLQTRRYDKHMDLDELYKGLPELVDTFIEGLMSSRGAIFETGEAFYYQSYEKALPVLEDFVRQCKYIHALLEEDNEIGSVNSIEDIVSFVEGIIYKLRILN